MAGASGELTHRDGIAALATLARRRETSLRAALVRMTTAVRDAHAEVAACDRACEAQRLAWQNALLRGGIYDQREATGVSCAVEAARASLGEAQARHARAIAGAQQADAALQAQRERLQANSCKQEKLRELLTLYRC